MKKATNEHSSTRRREKANLSLSPLPFDEALTDLLKVPPPREKASRKKSKPTHKQRKDRA